MNVFFSFFLVKRNINFILKYVDIFNEIGYFKNLNKEMCLLLIFFGFKLVFLFFDSVIL